MRLTITGFFITLGAVIATASGAAADKIEAHRAAIDDGATPPIWNSWYVGASVGYGWGESDYYLAQAGHGAATNRPSGFAGSLMAGRNWQFPNRVVLGIEGDLGLMDLTDQRHWRDDHLFKSQFGPFWATLRGRAGYLWSNRLLLFATAGAAFLETDETVLGAGEGEANPGQTSPNRNFHLGWVAGLGAEYAYSERLSAKLEYLHMDFDQFQSRNGNGSLYTFEDHIDLWRVGVNYKF